VGILLDASWFVENGALALVILLFPDGALPSPRWRWVLWSYLVVTACYTAITYISVISTPGHDARINSSGTLTPDPTGWFAAVTRLSGAVFAAFWLSFMAAQVLSWRHSSGVRRQQLKWPMSGAAALAVSQAIDQLSIATVRCGGGCSRWWTGGSTGQDMTPIRPSRHSRLVCRTPWT
jgi:hypothetical protein